MMNPYKGQSSKLMKLIIIALLGSISMVLMLLNFPLPMLPPYLKIDFSEVPALVAAILFTPMAGVAVEGLKNLMYMIYTGAADPIGVLANFTAGTLFVVPAAMIYHKFKTKKSLISGLIGSSVIMTIGMSVLNFFIILPAYTWFMGWETMSANLKLGTIAAGILPFNLVKGLIVSLMFIALFNKLQPWIKQKRMSSSNAA
ncbi:ECF transporter S component [Halobacillus yeomjeoni]|uniref:Riboflavin transporter n=1 Tax=Halobacillus yeomjeoni TaxID=311194 RepID=A0A931HX76_9BACI|nr:ECF transporter S component [Halobacillus yeomjeoni]MBH0231070.1 ECF transporter S component [Halobacillus yeomjeoni]MCA0984485.1 ECF transporter S component [Halobacillus yeomjeoni]